jgi:hypothetical protein
MHNKPAVECCDIFAEPKDLTICDCRGDVPQHLHCAQDGAIILAEGGGGDDGSKVGGYTDALKCAGNCGAYLCHKMPFLEHLVVQVRSCGREINGEGPFCFGCANEYEANLRAEDAMWEHGHEAVKSLRSCRAMLRSETNPQKVRELISTVQEAQDELVGLERDLLAFLVPNIKADDTPTVAVTLRENGSNTIHAFRSGISESDGSREVLYSSCGERFHNGRATVGDAARINCGRCLRIGAQAVAS